MHIICKHILLQRPTGNFTIHRTIVIFISPFDRHIPLTQNRWGGLNGISVGRNIIFEEHKKINTYHFRGLCENFVIDFKFQIFKISRKMCDNYLPQKWGSIANSKYRKNCLKQWSNAIQMTNIGEYRKWGPYQNVDSTSNNIFCLLKTAMATYSNE